MVGAFSRLGLNQKLWAEDLIERVEENGTLKGIDKTPDVADYTIEEQEMLRAALIPGIWKMHIRPEPGLNIDVEQLEELRQFIGGCCICDLREVYDCPVPFEYTERSKMMVIAEAPGQDETREGRPLIGRAGDELIIKRMRPYGIIRQDLFLSNIYKCRPLDNKLPPDVSHDCWELLKMEIDVLQPKFILALGNYAREFFTGQKTGIQAAAEKLRPEVEIVGGRPIPVLYSVHPASCFYSDGAKNGARLKNSIEVFAKIMAGEYEEVVEEEEEDE
jgi:uracil-DNA glycosylase family 4